MSARPGRLAVADGVDVLILPARAGIGWTWLLSMDDGTGAWYAIAEGFALDHESAWRASVQAARLGIGGIP